MRHNFKPDDFSIFKGDLVTFMGDPSDFFFSNPAELICPDINRDSSGHIISATLDGKYISNNEAVTINFLIDSFILLYSFEDGTFESIIKNLGPDRGWLRIDQNLRENIKQLLKSKVLSMISKQEAK